jgi:hypothetical protein
MSDQALRPTVSFKDFLLSKKEVIDETAEEQILANGAANTFWAILKDRFIDAMHQLDQVNETAIASGAEPKQIGENAIVISQVKGVLKQIINVVEDAKEAHEQSK